MTNSESAASAAWKTITTTCSPPKINFKRSTAKSWTESSTTPDWSKDSSQWSTTCSEVDSHQPLKWLITWIWFRTTCQMFLSFLTNNTLRYTMGLTCNTMLLKRSIPLRCNQRTCRSTWRAEFMKTSLTSTEISHRSLSRSSRSSLTSRSSSTITPSTPQWTQQITSTHSTSEPQGTLTPLCSA